MVVDCGVRQRGVGELGVVWWSHRRVERGVNDKEDASYQITIKLRRMPVQVAELEQAIRDAFPVSHLQIEDKSSGCGESYSVLLVSDVRRTCRFCSLQSSEPSSIGVRGKVDPRKT